MKICELYVYEKLVTRLLDLGATWIDIFEIESDWLWNLLDITIRD